MKKLLSRRRMLGIGIAGLAGGFAFKQDKELVQITADPSM